MSGDWVRGQRSAQPVAADAASLIKDETLALHYRQEPFMNKDKDAAAVTAPTSLEP